MLGAGRELLYAVMLVMQAHAAAFREIEGLTGTQGVAASIHARLKQDLSHLAPPNFIALYDRPRLVHLERYLRALAIRARRALLDPEKDIAKAQALQKYTEQLRRMMETLNPQSSAPKRRALDELVWMIEEYKVSVFAQELKTAGPMSPKRLDEKIRAIERMT
jgi:ATP-dependent helicase HrpA